MSLKSYGPLELLARSGETDSLIAHLEILLNDDPEDLYPANFALLVAVDTNQLNNVRALLEIGTKVEAPSLRPYICPLWQAAKRGHLDMVKLLVSYGADTNAADNRGMTALDYAKRYSRNDVVAYLAKSELNKKPGIGSDCF